ncbi:MAG: hypothetical protein EPGJADBJ_01999 [Saprospiraceae bacterium]|nr:hypothetical protein [Saprospiraceae bacterium]
MFLRFGLLAFFVTVFSMCAMAQPETPIYNGLRISLFDVSIKKQKSESVSVKLSVVNTGRLPVTYGKKDEAPPENLVIELDTVNLPTVLRGRENLLTEAIQKEKIALRPGEILRDMLLEIRLKSPDTTGASSSGEAPGGQICADLVFDTVYITQYTDETMSLRFVIRNAGSTTAFLLGNSDEQHDNLAVNVYFISGTKLTRGAILADGMFIQKSRETLDGLLLPGHMLEGDIQINLAKRTKFAPNLVFELDPFQAVADCNRANNTKGLVVEF